MQINFSSKQLLSNDQCRCQPTSRCHWSAALYVPAHNNKFMHAFSAPVPFLSPASVHDKHANWTIIKSNTEKNINSHIVRLAPTTGCLLLVVVRISSMKENFQFAIRASRANRSRRRMGIHDPKSLWKMLINIDWFLIVFGKIFAFSLLNNWKLRILFFYQPPLRGRKKWGELTNQVWRC